ncbi:hypothetical protein VTL71DRAFT_9026 [Oculimacula yallundae]|uniref:Uncharacterized protein n=1 Tax=Oculimacula yallundae TaxID=86028 RepID=A0ABR4BTK2_9HELO
MPMASESLPTSPHSHLTTPQISDFVLHYLDAQNASPNAPVSGKQLIQACQDELSDKYTQTGEQFTGDRQRIVEVIKDLKVGKVLRAFAMGEGLGFCVAYGMGRGGPIVEEERGGVVLGDEARSVDAGADGEGDDTPRALRNDDHEYPRTGEDAEQDEEETQDEDDEAHTGRTSRSEEQSVEFRSSQQDSIDRAESLRNKEAYEAMTANAVPLLEHPSEQPSMQTPTRKRTLPFEIADSEDRSSLDPISPHRYANSTPRRSPKRMRPGTPFSGSRRRSAPTGLWSPRKGDGLGAFKSLKLSQSSAEKAVFKEEKPSDTTAAWILDLIDVLHFKWPESHFEPSNGSVKCLDCEGREFGLSRSNTFSGFESHLRGKPHKEKVLERANNPKYQYNYPESLLLSKTTNYGMDFNVPQPPLAVFANKTSPPTSVAALGAQFFAAMDADTQAKGMKLMSLEMRQHNAETKTKERIDKLDASFDSLNEKIDGLSDDFAEKVEASKNLLRNEIEVVQDRLDASESRSKDQFKDLTTRVTKISEECGTKLDKLFTSMAKSDHRNIENIEDIKDQLQKSTEATEEQLTHLKESIEILEGYNSNSQRDDIEASIRGLESSDLENRNLRSKMETRLNAIDELIRESQRIRTFLHSQIRDLQTSHQETKTDNSRLQVRVEELEKADVRRQKEFHDMEAKLQMQSEELQRQRESNLAYQKTIKDQVQHHVEKVAKDALRDKEEMLEREQALEERLMGMFEKKFECMEKVNEEERDKSRKKIQSLERKIKRLEGDLDDTQECIGSMVGSLEAVEELKEKVDGLEELAVGMGAGAGFEGRGMRGLRAGSEVAV